MCIVIDPGSLPSVLSSKAQDHAEFKPVLKWITSGKGKIVYGGKHYDKELWKLKRYIPIIAEFSRAGKVVKVDSANVDREELQVDKRLSHRDFDDQHIVAIVIVSRCMLVCTKDKRSCRFLKQNKLYPSNMDRPKIYSRAKNADLLVNKNIAAICS